jgi:SAM-dependent methyltransferase
VTGVARSWVEYWNSDSPVYVSERHKIIHARCVASDIISLVPGPDARVLDYGCGEALEAQRVAEHCGLLMLHDAAPAVLAGLAARHAGNDRISVLDRESVAALEPGSLDLIVINSVAQYIPKPDFEALLASLAPKLKAGGRLITGDILPEGLSPLTDAGALLNFGFQGGFFLPAVVGLFRTFFSEYRKIRGALGLTQYQEAEMLALIERAGLQAARLPRNLGHNQARMTFAGVKTD